MRIITGCPRSGTSFVAQVLRELGGEFGDERDLIQADHWNPGGYLESRAVNILNHRLLFGGWSKPELWVDIMWPKDIRIRAKKLATLTLAPFVCRPGAVRRRGERMRPEIADMAARFKGRMVKDPRFSYLMQPWLAGGDVEKVLYVIRHPWESASSMKRQTGLPLAFTYRAWSDSVTKFGPLPDRLPVHYVDFNAFFDEETRECEMRTLFEFADVGFDGNRAATILSKIFDNKLRSRVATTHARIPRKVNRLYRGLLQKREAGAGEHP